MLNCVFDELLDAQAVVLRHIEVLDVLAFDLGALVRDQVTEVPNSDCVKGRKVKPKLVSAEVIGLRLVLELGFDFCCRDLHQLVRIGVDLAVVLHINF